ncbi:MAG TPA: hypothetical protein QGG18_06570 [Rhodospirillales bacterium]|nr:hypothetical protein [Rhodospirillales bacterium]
METLPSAEDIRGAALQIEEEAAKTPVLESALLNERIDAKGKTVGIVLFWWQCGWRRVHKSFKST